MVEQNQLELEVSFGGPALAEGRMNVRDLAPSMLSMGSLFESANKILNGERASVNINVRATASGSFEVLYEIVQMQAGMPLEELLSTAADMKELLFGGGAVTALFTLVKWLRGRKPKVEKVNDSLFKLTIDNQTYEVPIELLKLYQDANIRKSLEDIVHPVKEDGIEVFEVRHKKCLVQSVKKQDVDAFDYPEFQEHLLDETRRYAFSIISLAFKEDNKWRLTDGQAIYTVSIKDSAFLRRVDKNEIAFAKGDVLVCDLRTIQWQVPDGVRTEYEITKVHSHKPARQLPMLNLLDEAEGNNT